MRLGNLVSGAGAVAGGYREQEALIRKAREDELRLQAMNRANTQYKQAAAEEQMANTQGAVAETARNKFDVGTRPLPPPPARVAGVRTGTPVAQNPTTTLNPAAKQPTVAAPDKPQMTQQEFANLPAKEQQRLLQIENDRRKLAQVGHGISYLTGGVYDLAAGPYNQIAKGADVAMNAVGVPRLGRALGVYGPDVNEVEIPKIGDGSYAPAANARLRDIAANKALSVEEYLQTLPMGKTGGRRGGSSAARKTNAQAGLAIPGGEMLPAEGFASDAAVERYNKLTQQLPAAVQSEQGQAVISRAQELGVDPAAAITIFGIESNFGGNGSESGKGAKGGMQVTDETFNGMKAWYTDGRGAAAGATPQQIDAAANMQRGDPQSEIDAGLLRIQYNQYVGVPRPLWGAAYQAPAEAVRDNGGPINADDGNFTNGEYSSVYANLYNQAVNTLGGAQGPLPGAVATLASTGRPEAVSGAGSAAPAGDTAPAAAPVAGVAPPGTPPRSMAATAATAARPKSKAQFYLANPDSITSDMSQAQEARAQLVRMGNLQLRLRTAEGYDRAQEIKAKVRALDNGMVDLQGYQGVIDLEMANDPGRLEQALSIKTGQEVRVRPFTDGTFDVYINGQKAQENVSGADLKDHALSLFDAGYRELKAAQSAKAFEKGLDYNIEAMKKEADIFQSIVTEQTKGDVQLAVEKFKAKHTDWKVDIHQDTGDVFFLPPGQATPMVYNREAQTVRMGDSDVPITGARQVPGLDTRGQ